MELKEHASETGDYLMESMAALGVNATMDGFGRECEDDEVPIGTRTVNCSVPGDISFAILRGVASMEPVCSWAKLGCVVHLAQLIESFARLECGWDCWARASCARVLEIALMGRTRASPQGIRISGGEAVSHAQFWSIWVCKSLYKNETVGSQVVHGQIGTELKPTMPP